ncbi:vacuolar protein sorting-associated protein 72 homolog [Hylobates moloch]|uniref:vacuolar protein sorting-associated protein 72 homolog n=1 Tax=Hylobates moloch TaxID=81572 RepID=UPI00136381EA|nr:vacuolar protein sorting-associated protein 72 homolog [Hylobates moloch]
MSLAGGRAPRKTAGNRLSGLLEAEEEDEFYQTTYGGFTEESGDDEYQGDQSDTEDEVDSDFDIDEGDEPSSDGEAEEPRRKRRVVTKAYKEPLKSLRPRKVNIPAGSSQKAREEKALLPLELQDDGSDSRKSMRQSTAEHTRQTFLRVQERQGQSRRRKGPHCERPLTQEELLREAKITEELNLRSLETYERLEADKKKQVHKKRKCPGPIITYHSVTVPLVGEPGPKEENVDIEGLDPVPSASALTPHAGTGPVNPPARCSRTFITFSDDATFEEWFPQGRPPKVPVREVCPVTHRPALYRDPVTDIPYATARAFKIIREAYKKYITAHGLPPTASALGPGPPPPEPLPGSGPRALRQKIVIK